MPAQRSVLLVDDHPVTRLGVRLLLDHHESFVVCGEASNVDAAKRLTEELCPDFIVLDLLLGGRDGPELVEDLLAIHEGTRILVFSSLDEVPYAKRALKAGARGYVRKACGLEEVGASLEKIARGEYAFGEIVQRTLFEEAAGGKARDALGGLSNRELQIYRMLGEGLGTADIAADLRLSMKTIGTYRERLKNKLNLQTAQSLEQSARDYIRQGTSRV